jgi:alpha/beta superfamily hydrolase
MRKVVIFLLLVTLAITKKNLKEASKEKTEDHKTVVEANHFYSNYERNTTYEINGIEKNKSLILILKNGGKTDKELK